MDSAGDTEPAWMLKGDLGAWQLFSSLWALSLGLPAMPPPIKLHLASVLSTPTRMLKSEWPVNGRRRI